MNYTLDRLEPRKPEQNRQSTEALEYDKTPPVPDENRPTDYDAEIANAEIQIQEETSTLNKLRARLGLAPAYTSVTIESLLNKRGDLVVQRDAHRGTGSQNNSLTRDAGLHGEVLGPDDEDPRVLRRFDELPEELGDLMKRMDKNTRRLIMGDETILQMPYDRLYEIALLTAGPGKHADDKLLHSLRFPEGRPPHENTPIHEMQDITPLPARSLPLGQNRKFLPRN